MESDFPPPSSFSGAELPRVAYPEGFQGNSIPLDGTLVANICHERISGSAD